MSGRAHEVKFQELYLELSNLCNAECDHCYVSSSPRADRTKLDVDLACRAIEESLSIAEIAPQVTIAGGEPTLFWDDLLTIIKYASQRNLRVLLITNGWWAQSLMVCRQKLSALVEHGLTRLEISSSAYHRKYVDPAGVNNIALVGRDMPVQLALHVRTNQSSDEQSNLSFFKNLEQVELISAPVIPVGRAAEKVVVDEFVFVDGFPRGSCHEDLSFVINPKGDCFPCCGGSELSEYLCLGNLHDEPLTVIVDRAKERELLHCITRKGPAQIAEALMAEGFTEIVPGNYVNICDLCAKIFRSPRLAIAAERWANSPATRVDMPEANGVESQSNPVMPAPVSSIPINIITGSRPIAPRPSYDKEASVTTTTLTLEEIIAELPGLPDGTSLLNGLLPYSRPEPSGASLFAVGDYYLKMANGPYGSKLVAQATWLKNVWSIGVRCVPEVLAQHVDKDGFAVYVMRKYRMNMPGAKHSPPARAREVLACLEDIWKVPASTSQPVDWIGYIERVEALLAQHDVEASRRLAKMGRRISEMNGDRVESCTVHGDPTFENIVYGDGGNLILLDPNPQTQPAVCIPELDVAKVLQSVFGWEAFVYRQKAALKVNTTLLPFIETRFGLVGWPTCIWLLATHLVRTLPYGAKVGEAARLLPSIHNLLQQLDDLSLRG